MAAELIAAGYPDTDGDGVPDIMDRIQRDSAFGPGRDNWKIRRRLTIGVIVVSYGVCLMMAAVWLVKALLNHADIPSNLLNFGSTIFWAMNVTATSLLVAYTGMSLADTNSYRKSMVNIATRVSDNQPPRRRPPMGGYDGNYGGQDYYTPDAYSQQTYAGRGPQDTSGEPPVQPRPDVIR